MALKYNPRDGTFYSGDPENLWTEKLIRSMDEEDWDLYSPQPHCHPYGFKTIYVAMIEHCSCIQICDMNDSYRCICEYRLFREVIESLMDDARMEKTAILVHTTDEMFGHFKEAALSYFSRRSICEIGRFPDGFRIGSRHYKLVPAIIRTS